MTFAGSLSHIFSNLANPGATDTNSIPSSAIETESGGFHLFEFHLPSSGATILLIFLGILACLCMRQIFCSCGKCYGNWCKKNGRQNQRRTQPNLDLPAPAVAFSGLEDGRQALLDYFYQQHLDRLHQNDPRPARRPALSFQPDRFQEVNETARPTRPARRAPQPPAKPARPSGPSPSGPSSSNVTPTAGPSSLHF